VLVVINAYVPHTETTHIETVLIPVGIEAEREVYAIVCTIIIVIVHGHIVIVIVAIAVAAPYPHRPSATYQMYGAEEVVAIHKPTVLTAAKHIHQIFVAHIEQIVIIVDGIIVSIHHIVEHLIHLIEEVKVDLVHILILTIRESELICHTITEEAGLATDIRQTHCCKTLCTDSCQGYKH
jgi:hypothetical protein